VNAARKAIIERALQKTGGNRNEAAKLLGLTSANSSKPK
jgi:transcriptional regulator with PAS, ATPase and Fis domain